MKIRNNKGSNFKEIFPQKRKGEKRNDKAQDLVRVNHTHI